MSYPVNDLGNALTNQIYQSVVGGDGNVSPPDDVFLVWTPGLALTADDFDFAADGIYSAPTAEETKERLLHAFNMSVLLDFVPNPATAYASDAQQGMFTPDGGSRLSDIYREILRFSKVAEYPLTPAQEAKLARFRGLLTTTETVKDLITDEEKEITGVSPLLKAYNDRMADYVSAALKYNAKRVAAAAASGPEGRAAVADWSMNAQLYYLEVKAAADRWAADGHRSDVDQINAYINQTTQRSLLLWKQQLIEDYDKAQLTSPDVSMSFPYTTIVPGNIAESDGWVGLEVTHRTTKWSKHNETRSWKAGGGLGLGIVNLMGGGSGSSSSQDDDFSCESFSMSFEMAQGIVVRAGFNPLFFASRGWTLNPGEGWTFDQMPSDGGDPPKGEFVGYATQIVLVRNVVIDSKDFVAHYQQKKAEWGASAAISLGPVMLGGSYTRGTTDETFEAEVNGSKLTVKGMQCVGMVCHLLGKTPDPLADIPPERFV